MKKLTAFFAPLTVLCLFLMTGCQSIDHKSMSITIIYSATVVLSLLVLVTYFFLIRKKNAWFILLFSSVPIVNIGYQWLSTCSTIDSALWANRLSYLGSVFLPMAMLMIILQVTKRSYKKWLPWVLFGIAVAVFIVTASPGFSDIYYKEVSLQTINGATVLNKVYGVLHPLFLFYLLGYFTCMVAAVIHATVKKKIDSNARAVVLAFAVFINIGVWLFEQLSRIDFEFLSVSYIICEIFLLGLDYVIQEYTLSPQPQATVTTTPDTVPATVEASREQLDQFAEGITRLTHTERLVFDLYLQGKTTKEVLATLNIKENTLKYHNRNIYSKLGVSSRKELKSLAKLSENNNT